MARAVSVLRQCAIVACQVGGLIALCWLAVIGGIGHIEGPPSAWASGYPVYDMLTHVATTIQTAKIVDGIEETAKIVQQGAQQLAKYAHLAHITKLIADMHRLIGQLRTVSNNMLGRADFWDKLRVPESMEQLGIFNGDARKLCRMASLDALGMQGLLGQLANILVTITDLLSGVQDIAGDTSGLQSVSGGVNYINASLVTLGGITSSANEASICRSLTEQTERDAMDRIGEKFYSDWGAYTRP